MCKNKVSVSVQYLSQCRLRRAIRSKMFDASTFHTK